MSRCVIGRAKRLVGELRMPGDKSLSHRAALCAALSEGVSRLQNFSPSLDCERTLACLRALGVPIEVADAEEGMVVVVRGMGLEGFTQPQHVLDAGNSGSTIRMLAGILAGQRFESTITGDMSLQRRPMDRIVHPLRLMGASVRAREERYAPLTICGGSLRPIWYRMPVASAQVKSCVLLAGLFASGTTTVEEAVPTRDHTEIMLAEFGARVNSSGGIISVVGRPQLRAREYRIAGDISSAAFFIAGALALSGSHLLVRDVLLNPTRTGFLDVLRQWGARIEIENVRRWHGEPVGDVRVVSPPRAERGRAEPLVLSGALIPKVIDEIPVLAVLATQMPGGMLVREATELRVKESDRIRVLVENLRRMGAQVIEYADGFAVAGPQALRGAEIEHEGDHRLAMAFAIAGLLAEGETIIRDPEVAAISFPAFFRLLEQIVER
ncbi:MAG: 3-phosphoshikimate 1-carboxyvinyltransferase [Blastocatellia bacterium]|nr:3-phosphoshikimate 1-carboxyvinyltransferase [Blastocatellia bacterium]MCS7156430.1 3-phosphoshikimate 1-carboxyvinyltransferase [Blastocatellia bacterium]MCX7751829.1 3-phosphoshikimate 1-carboxyvinyltransferase [Blastocatellia bacterium]MDW8168931.1 3-phosphoshikimate 1-carboxyvinyltransferase [Acidobacteriota bacterium]MDW8256691.1 3-phosphoshikimate 1-carboxyvinyltransferase [Acidobacteriota bacterium]